MRPNRTTVGAPPGLDRLILTILLLIGGIPALLSACGAPVPDRLIAPTVRASYLVTLTVDGQTSSVTTAAETVGELLIEAGVVLGPLDEVAPPGPTRLAMLSGASINVTRISERVEVAVEDIPFGRRLIRSAEMLPDDPPQLLQAGRAGQQEVTYRVVTRDGREAERRRAEVTVIESPRDEIVMIGVGQNAASVTFEGVVGYLDGARAILLEGSSDRSRPLSLGGAPDGRVFQLSPDGTWLLYSVGAPGRAGSFGNSLFVISTAPDAAAQSLGIDNVLWAGWDPAASSPPRIAYTTARSTSLPPGWEANNDLWLLDWPIDGSTPTAPVRLIETYPATYGWWGGNYAWSPDGTRLAYAFADEIGLIAMPAPGSTEASAAAQPGADLTNHQPIVGFTPLDTRSDWAWVPDLAWSTDGERLLYTVHAAADTTLADPFDIRYVGPDGEAGTLAAETGAWSRASWSAPRPPEQPLLAYLRANEPDDSLESDYTLWLAAADGGNSQRLFPPEGEVSLFPRESQSMVWSPDGTQLAFIFDDALHLMTIASGEVYRATGDDALDSHPTWAPYGFGVAQP